MYHVIELCHIKNSKNLMHVAVVFKLWGIWNVIFVGVPVVNSRQGSNGVQAHIQLSCPVASELAWSGPRKLVFLEV